MTGLSSVGSGAAFCRLWVTVVGPIPIQDNICVTNIDVVCLGVIIYVYTKKTIYVFYQLSGIIV